MNGAAAAQQAVVVMHATAGWSRGRPSLGLLADAPLPRPCPPRLTCSTSARGSSVVSGIQLGNVWIGVQVGRAQGGCCGGAVLVGEALEELGLDKALLGAHRGSRAQQQLHPRPSILPATETCAGFCLACRSTPPHHTHTHKHAHTHTHHPVCTPPRSRCWGWRATQCGCCLSGTSRRTPSTPPSTSGCSTTLPPRRCCTLACTARVGGRGPACPGAWLQLDLGEASQSMPRGDACMLA